MCKLTLGQHRLTLGKVWVMTPARVLVLIQVALSKFREGPHQKGLLPVEPVVDEQPLVLHARRGVGEVWLASARGRTAPKG